MHRQYEKKLTEKETRIRKSLSAVLVILKNTKNRIVPESTTTREAGGMDFPQWVGKAGGKVPLSLKTTR